ncbi:death-associated protein-like 1 homolog [Oncorhynchus nerka]|uniref:Death associated protein like 1 n=4 Tax=Salmoninae TaxID=504568 RepID=A0A060VY63_ONCMY|nr:death-associated protein-like 1-A [Oncorhynchus kisutch]XP_021452716.1 death-associated protein-like 1-A [Oncorhynchus mykiss]XP_024260152.1 death-associated protein-like 1-A [Oncorhynchus tshawytscha]XP_029499671.1 death-associated protein-like 1-A [Oncorhynchus nerka]XP_035606083.1 death-associated protein-like 1-A [Oncorhynchus keta]XP_038862250.1 death-associated protein-like 1-A [Salvelinus namaycush]XP_046216969.1 death-associated protein-like 1-A [Oncorhynchus gorbuscha]CDQ57235.1 
MVQLSKSGVRESPELKAGHPPAVKAGGKRVVKKSCEESHATHHVNPEREHKVPKPRSAATSSRMQQISVLMSGTLDKLGHDFPETPVSVKHSRLRPAMEKAHSPAFKSSFCIQQPKKF